MVVSLTSRYASEVARQVRAMQSENYLETRNHNVPKMLGQMRSTLRAEHPGTSEEELEQMVGRMAAKAFRPYTGEIDPKQAPTVTTEAARRKLERQMIKRKLRNRR